MTNFEQSYWFILRAVNKCEYVCKYQNDNYNHMYRLYVELSFYAQN